MKKIRIHFKVSDQLFFNQLQSYILLNYHHVMDCVNENYDYVITDQPIKEVNAIVIGEHQFDIYKYQKASKICSSIMNMTSLESEEIKKDDTKEYTKLLAVTSTRGGAGKTKKAQDIALFLASKHKKVLYILMDSFSPLDGDFTDEHENDISKFIYYVANNKDVNKAIEAVKSYDHIKEVYFIRSLYPSLDGFIEGDLAKKISEAMAHNDLYDYIIYDIPSYLTKGHIMLMDNVSYVLLINNLCEKRDQVYSQFLKMKIKSKCIEIKKDDTSESIMEMME